jgi:D-alanyl-D-alanine carboxypeptidase
MTKTIDWLQPALRYGEQWLDYQVKASELPGCVLAVAHQGKVVAERAYGVADLVTGAPMTASHRFRVASHSKTFTTAAILKLREQNKLGLDDAAGRWVKGLSPAIAALRISQLLSHSAGLVRDGADAPHWLDRDDFFSASALRAELARPLTLAANARFKYSNVGFGLLGLIIEAITTEPYGDWIMRQIVKPSGLTHTTPDLPGTAKAPLAMGHTGRLPVGRHPATLAQKPTNAMAAATGFTSTARDLTRFFASLDPRAPKSVLSAESRREMTRRHWSVPHSKEPRWYGLGTMHGNVDGHGCYGHSGGFPGFITRTAHVPDWNVTISLLTNAIDGQANPWVDGLIGILHRFSESGPPAPKVAKWAGRWWSIWASFDLVPMGDKVVIADPAALTPFVNAGEIEVSSATKGRISLAEGYGHHGERVVRTLDKTSAAKRLQLGGNHLVPEEVLMKEIRTRADKHRAARRTTSRA